LTSDYRKILIFRYGQLGDTLVALPSLWTIRKNFPDAHIILLSERPKSHHVSPEKILPRSGLIDDYVLFDPPGKDRNLLNHWHLARRLRAWQFDLAVYLAPSLRPISSRIRDMLFFQFAGIKEIKGLKGFPKKRHARRKHPLPSVPMESDSLLQRLRVGGLSVPSLASTYTDLALSTEEREKVRSWWESKVIRRDSNGWFAVAPGSKMPSKIWPYENYVATVQRIMLEMGLRPIILGGVEDRPIGLRMIAEWGDGLCGAGELSVRESATALESVEFYLGNDTGTMHLAAAVGTPCVAIFSAQDWPGRWYPYGGKHEVLRIAVPCEGCRLQVCNRNMECLRGISPDKVFDSCLRVMKKFSSKQRSCIG